MTLRWRSLKNGYRVLCGIVREEAVDYSPQITSPAVCKNMFMSYRQKHPELWPNEREAFVVAFLDNRYRVIAMHTVSIGSHRSTTVEPMPVFRFAVMIGATAIVTAHNHPSGDPEPSKDDDAMTERLTEAGKILGIEMLDHLIFGERSFYSYSDHKTNKL